MTSFESFLQKVKDGAVLTEEEMEAAMHVMMAGGASEGQMADFLTALARRGETAGEITGAAKVLRQKALSIKAPEDALDCCGTGGDSAGTYNISTAVAIVSAACGVPVAKHGNRAASSKSGAADVLEALGVHLDVEKDRLERALEDIGFCFLMAPQHHEAMKHVAKVRKELGFRTIFNLLGPLANPAGTQYQLIGVFDEKWLLPLAETLKNLGTKRAWVVHGTDGLDEITTTGPTKIAVLEGGKITEKTLRPEDFGLPVAVPEALKGGDAQENARALKALLKGEKSAYRDIVLANVAAVLTIHGTVNDLKDGVRTAANALDTKKALSILNQYIVLSSEGNR
ncbi:MAG: anthranilate phosphoribosyltransferase [Rhodospirillales bacterium]|nr:anthranilate phosphoribosyltransferase [Alphaproteobacteria bacterium]USO03314.1 MAG: anthranilate phosphoribosyltransferase [Rhodospirillales bacterium]